MKKIYTIIFIGMLLSVSTLKAQVQHLCGNDTLILHLNNYQYGQIQWEESEDSLTWKIIDGAIDTVYKFYPDGNKFYRAGIAFSLCQITYSDIFMVSMGVKANAGMDIKTSIPNLNLSANKPIGCTGQWSIISGTGGSIADVTNPLSKFTGQVGQTYQLVWSLTNICGTTTDTMNIQMIQNVYRKNIVYVDTTDIVLSDSTQKAQGNYTIKFSSPVPTVTDSTVLIFLTQDKSLLKVQSVSMKIDTAVMTTTQGSLQDFMISGVIDFSPFNYKIDTLTKGVENRLPTRQEILNNNYANGQVLFYNKNTSGSFAKLNKTKNTKGLYDDNTLSLQVNPVEVYNDSNITLQISGNIDFTPNLVSYYELGRGWFNIPYYLDTLILELNNAKLHYSLVPELIIHGERKLVNFEKKWKLYQQDAIVMIGTVPVWISADISVKAIFTIDANGTLDAKLTYTYDREYNAGIYYGQHDKKFTPFYNATEPRKTITPEITGQATLDQRFQLGPSFTLKLFNTLSGYVDFYALTENFNACLNNQFDWDASFGLSSELTLGAYIAIANKELYKDDLSHTWTFGWFNDKFPYTITKESGDMQSGTLEQNLTYPVKVKVESDWGIPMPFVNVYFAPVNGSVQNAKVKTDINGYAETNWTPDNTVGTQYLNAYIKDRNSNIMNSKTSFTSYVNADTKDCEKSTLDMTLDIDKTKNTIKPIAKRGVLPYQYSTDGINYQSTLPVLALTNGTTYKFYVQDTKGCTISKSYTYSLNPCANTDITFNVSIDNRLRNIVVTPQGGQAPYQYAYLNSSTFTTNNTNTFSSPGIYTVYVKDANACQANSTITIQAIKDSIGITGTVTDIDGNIYNALTIGTQTWMQKNLNVTHYNDGTAIPLVTDNTAWGNDTTPAYCNYNNTTNVDTINTYGRLYNWFTVTSNKLCPFGWHIPDTTEWNTLINYLGGSTLAGGHLKEAGITHWLSPNTGADNSSEFTALPAGNRSNGFVYLGTRAYFWSNPERGYYAWNNCLVYQNAIVSQYLGRAEGFSVRCLKDITTTSSLPKITTDSISNIAQNTATGGGNVTSDGGATVTARGVCWSTNQNPTITDSKTIDGMGTGSFASNITGLTANTTYYVRAYATNSVVTGYGNQVSFTTTSNRIIFNPNLTYRTVTDIEGNVYKTITIGTQTWTAENLKTTKYNDGTSIPLIIDDDTWQNVTTPAYCNYNNTINVDTINTYGRLYNWYTINTGKLCPTDWHVPTDTEWNSLEKYLDNTVDTTIKGSVGTDIGNKLKEKGTTHWNSPNTNADNSSGFTALPGGLRSSCFFGIFCSIGISGSWWSSTTYSTDRAWCRSINYNQSNISRLHDCQIFVNYNTGSSVRCLRDY